MKNDPEYRNRVIESTKAANLKLDENGNSGYQRAYKNRQKTLLEKYGDENFYNSEKASKTRRAHSDEKRKDIQFKKSQTLMKNYGVSTVFQLQGYNFYRFSKISQALFDEIVKSSSIKSNEVLYGKTEKYLNGYFYDLTYKNKIIEFNGDYWHANPLKYSNDKTLRMVCETRLVEDIWARDVKKINHAISNGYEVKIVWENDFVNRREDIIKECIEWLSQS
jgi:G:T-mismatch repair DNA endonuclease (very short patch repair protein)